MATTEAQRRIEAPGEFLELVREWRPLAESNDEARVDPLIVKIRELGVDPIGELKSKINRRMSRALAYVEDVGQRIPVWIPGRPEPVDPFTALFFPTIAGLVVEQVINQIEVAIGRYEDDPDFAAPSVHAPPALSVDREGVFLAGQTFDAFAKIAGIIKSGTATVHIIDGYVGDGTGILGLCAAKPSAVVVRILTKAPAPAFKIAAALFQAQYGGLEVRTSNAFHDRFVVIDDRDFFHFGASLKDAGSRGFMFSRLEENVVIDTIRSAWAKEWAAGVIIV